MTFLATEHQHRLAITPLATSAKQPPAPPRKGRAVRWQGF
jgi:hypothetical protein